MDFLGKFLRFRWLNKNGEQAADVVNLGKAAKALVATELAALTVLDM